MEKKTAEQILSEYYEKGALDGEDHVIIAAMEEYAALQTASLQSSLSEKEAEIEKLKAIINGEGMRTNAELRKLNASQKAEIERLRGALYECEEAVFHTIDESKERISRIVNNHIPL
jgi:hypothetical protein